MGANGTGATGLGWAGTRESVHGPTGGSGGHALACRSRVSSPRPERQGRGARCCSRQGLGNLRWAKRASAQAAPSPTRAFRACLLPRAGWEWDGFLHPAGQLRRSVSPIAGLGSSFCFPRGCALLPRRREGRAGQESAHLAARHPLLSLCQTEMRGEEVQVSGQCASVRDWLSGEVTECLG